MVSRSKSSINIALGLAAMLVTVSTTQAQLSIIPKRYRSKSDYIPQEIGRKQRQQTGQQQQQQRKKTNLRKLEGDLSTPLQESEFDMSVPSGPSVRMMSIPTLDMSKPLQESDFDLSMPMDELPTLTRMDESEDVTTMKNLSNSDGSTLILASFLAGVSALIVGAMALFMKMRQKHGRQLEESQDIEDVQIQVVPSASDMQMQIVSFDDDQIEVDMEGEMRDITVV